MTNIEAINVLAKAIGVLADDGWVTNGELTFCRPRGTRKVGTLVNGIVKQIDLVTMEVGPDLRDFPKTPPVLPVAADLPLPNLFAKTAPPGAEYTGETCIKCHGARMVKAGSCSVCMDCGESGGCG